MSWYATITGEVVTSLQARPLVMELLGDWTLPKAHGKVRLREDKGKLVVEFNDHYRNLGGHVAADVWRIARAFPAETLGCFTVMSQDGCNYAATCRVEGGRVYRQTLDEAEEKEYRPRRRSTARS